MTPLYIFLLAVSAPVLLWMVFAGDADADGFDFDGDGPLLPIPLSAVAFFFAAFGFVGLVGGATSVGAVSLFVFSAVVALLAGIMSTQAFKWIRSTSSSSEVMDHELEGKIAKVALPVSVEHRGKIIVNIAGAREQMTASPADGSTIEVDERVVIVKVERGVALVAPLGPGLELE